MNEHARLYIRGVLKEGEEDSLIAQQWDAQTIRLTESGNLLFCGVTEDVGVICENGIFTAGTSNAMQISADKDLSASSGKKLALSASSSLEASCSASSMKMDGNINLKAILIKEN